MNFVINIDNLICKVDLDRGYDISILCIREYVK